MNALALSAKAAAGRLIPPLVITISRFGRSPAAAARPFSRWISDVDRFLARPLHSMW